MLFAPRLPEEYAVWMGRIKPLSEIKSEYEVDNVKYADELEEYLATLSAPVLLLKGKNHDSGSIYEPATLPSQALSGADLTTLFPILCDQRVYKSDEEVRPPNHST